MNSNNSIESFFNLDNVDEYKNIFNENKKIQIQNKKVNTTKYKYEIQNTK